MHTWNPIKVCSIFNVLYFWQWNMPNALLSNIQRPTDYSCTYMLSIATSSKYLMWYIHSILYVLCSVYCAVSVWLSQENLKVESICHSHPHSISIQIELDMLCGFVFMTSFNITVYSMRLPYRHSSQHKIHCGSSVCWETFPPTQFNTEHWREKKLFIFPLMKKYLCCQPTRHSCRLQNILDTFKCYIMNIEPMWIDVKRDARFHIICIVSHNSHYTNSDYMFTSHLLMKQQSFRWPDEFHQPFIHTMYTCIWDVRCIIIVHGEQLVTFLVLALSLHENVNTLSPKPPYTQHTVTTEMRFMKPKWKVIWCLVW